MRDAAEWVEVFQRGRKSSRFQQQKPEREVRREDRKTFTLFIDNIQPGVGNRELRKVFQKYGQVINVYISRK